MRGFYSVVPIFLAAESLIGLCFLCIGLAMRRRWNARLERERARATGTIESHLSPKDGQGMPVVRFRAEGQEIVGRCDRRLPMADYPEGAQLDVLYDPDDPRRFHLDRRDDAPAAARAFLWIGAIWMIAVVAAFLVLSRSAPMRRILRRPGAVTPVPAVTATGAPTAYADGYSYRFSGDNGAIITRCVSTSRTIDVPKTLNGRTVTGFDASAFFLCSGLERISLPGTIAEIPAVAFAGCPRLTSVTIGEGTRSIGVSAFGRNAQLMDVTLPASLTYVAPLAFAKDCYARFHVPPGSAAERYCRVEGFTIAR